MCTTVSGLEIEQCFIRYQTNPVSDLHDTRTRNRRRKNGVDLWRQFLECVSWVLDMSLISV